MSSHDPSWIQKTIYSTVFTKHIWFWLLLILGFPIVKKTTHRGTRDRIITSTLREWVWRDYFISQVFSFFELGVTWCDTLSAATGWRIASSRKKVPLLTHCVQMDKKGGNLVCTLKTACWLAPIQRYNCRRFIHRLQRSVVLPAVLTAFVGRTGKRTMKLTKQKICMSRYTGVLL